MVGLSNFDQFDRSDLYQSYFTDLRRLLSIDYIFVRGFLLKIAHQQNQGNDIDRVCTVHAVNKNFLKLGGRFSPDLKKEDSVF